MQFKSIILILACASGIIAFPTEAFSSHGYVELSREKASDKSGTLIYLAPTSGAKEKRRGGPICTHSARPTCDTNNGARNEICDQLITELYADPTNTVGEAPRQICYLGAAAAENAYCCVSWHTVVKNLVKGDLADHANTILKQCTTNGVSGKLYNIFVHATCTSVCLSNRGTHC